MIALKRMFELLITDGRLYIYDVVFDFGIENYEEKINKFFLAAYYEDIKRYWEKELVFEELVKRNFEVNLSIDYKREEVEIAELMDYVYNRDISVLTLIDKADYQAGVERMERLIKENSAKKITADFAEIFVVAQKV